MQAREKILETIRKYDMIRPGEKVLVGFSGGADSVCLLDSLKALSGALSCSIYALHVHHMLRGENADRDAAFAENFCRERGIPFSCVRADVRKRAGLSGESLEEAARAVRYEALRENAKALGCGKIALAHHRNDQAETVLFHMIRGSGIRGLSGIRPVRDEIIRPLYGLTRPEILQDLRKNHLSWCEDETNDSDEASRNVIRHYVLPALSSVRRDAVSKIAGTGEYLAEVEAYLVNEAREKLQSVPSRDGIGIDAKLLQDSPEILREYLVGTALRDQGFSMKDVTREHLKAAAGLASMQVGKKAELPGGIRAVRTYESVIFEKKDDKEEKKENWSMRIRIFPRPEGVNFPEKEYTKWFDYDKINGTPVLRTRRSGDRIAVQPSMHKKLKDWMIDRKIPKEIRDRIMLVADGEEILWVVGYRIGADARVTRSTARIMEITVEKEGEKSSEG